MHEFSITQKLLDVALKEAKARRILNVNLLIGSFCAEREESIQFYWRDLARGTPCETAELHFQHVETDLKCIGCGGALSLEGDRPLCTYCQNDRLQLLDGEDVKLESMEVE